MGEHDAWPGIRDASRRGAVTLAAGFHQGKARRMTPVTLVTLVFKSCPKNAATHEIIVHIHQNQVKPHLPTRSLRAAVWQAGKESIADGRTGAAGGSISRQRRTQGAKQEGKRCFWASCANTVGDVIPAFMRWRGQRDSFPRWRGCQNRRVPQTFPKFRMPNACASVAHGDIRVP